MQNTTRTPLVSSRVLGLCRKGLALGLLVGATAVFTTHVNTAAQTGTGDGAQVGGNAEGQVDPQMQQMMEMMERYGMPGEQHAELEKYVGTWDTTIRHWMEPGAEPQVSKGTVTYQMILDGHYLVAHHKSDWEGMPFEAIEVIGYDRFRERLFTHWYDNMSTGYMASVSADGSSDIHTAPLMGTMDDYMTGRRDVKVKSKTTMKSDDHTLFEMHTEMPDGTMHRMIEVECKRQGAKTPTGTTGR